MEMQWVLEKSQFWMKKLSYLVLIIKNSVNKNENSFANINYSKKSLAKYNTLTEYKNNLIIEVDLNYWYTLIKNNKEIWILDKNKILDKKIKEWLKLLTMQLWCQKCQDEVIKVPKFLS